MRRGVLAACAPPGCCCPSRQGLRPPQRAEILWRRSVREEGLANQIALLDAERRKLEDQLTAIRPIASLDAHRWRRQTQGES